MKKIAILMMLFGSVVMASNACFTEDFKKIKQNVIEANKLKDDKSPMAKMKYTKLVLEITKSAKHINDTHFNDMNANQKSEISNIVTNFTK